MMPDGRPAVAAGAEPATADITRRGEVLVIAVEVIYPGTECAGPHERIHMRAGRKQRSATGGRLIRIIASDYAGVVLKVIRPADPRAQHQMHVTKDVGRQNDKIRRLYQLTATRIDIRDSGRTLTSGIQVDPQD